MASGANHVLYGYEPPGARAFERGEVYPQLPRSTPGGVRGPRFLGSVSRGGLPGGVLSLLGCPACGFLGLARHLSGLIGGLARYLLGLIGRLAGGVLHALCHLSYLIGDSAQRTSAPLAVALLATAGEPAYGFLGLARNLPGLIGGLTRYLLGLTGRLASGVLGLLGRLTDGVLSLLGCPSGGFLRLAGHLSGLIGGLARYLLGLIGRLAGGVLGLLGRLPGLSVSLLILRPPAGPVFHRLGRLHHVTNDDTSVGARAFDLR
jgi:hypothetical protein